MNESCVNEIIHIHDTFCRETVSRKEVAADFPANCLPAMVLKHIRLVHLSLHLQPLEP